MLSILFLHIFITASCLLSGFLFYVLLNTQPGKTDYKSIIVHLIGGLVIISLVYQLLILFLPAGFYLTSTLWAGLLAGGYFFRKRCGDYIQFLVARIKNTNRIFIIISLLTWFMILVISAGPIIMDDTESYHIQTIKWIQEYGTVPGLANLHERFGFNSAWLTLISVFTPSHTSHNYYSVMNGVLSVWFSVYLLSALWKHLYQPNSTDFLINPAGILLILFFAIICWPLIRGNAANTNYDFITTFIIVVLFIELWSRKKNIATGTYFTEEMLLWPFFLFTVRITNFPLLLVSGFALVHLIRFKKVRILYILGSISIILVLAFLIRNVILTGYIFYPLYQIDFFSFDWKADPEAARQISVFIKYFNRIPSLPVEETAKLTGITWIPMWFHDLVIYDKVITITGVLGFGFYFLFTRKKRRPDKIILFYALVLSLQIATWLLIAPDTRFCYGPLLVGCYLTTTLFENKIKFIFIKPVKTAICILLAASILLYSMTKVVRYSHHHNLLAPALLPFPPVHITLLNGIELRTPEKISGNWNARCYGTDLPCLYKIQPGLKARGTDIKDGFKIER